MGLGGREEACMKGTALVKKRSRTGAAVENALFPWGDSAKWTGADEE